MKQAFHQQKRKSFNTKYTAKKCTRKEALSNSVLFIKAKKPASCISNLQI